MAVSVGSGHATASGMLRRLVAYPRQNGLAVALREISCIERTLFTLDWIRDPVLRRRAKAGLNMGEARNALARAVFFHHLLIRHIAPLGWEHISLTGDYIWAESAQPIPGLLRPLRDEPSLLAA